MVSRNSILIVEDEQDILRLTKYMLIKHGYQVETASNSQEAIGALKHQKPDLVLLDFHLPGGDGTVVSSHIRDCENLRELPILLFTATQDADAAEKAKLSRADSYITKPYDSESLLMMIQDLLLEKQFFNRTLGGVA